MAEPGILPNERADAWIGYQPRIVGAAALKIAIGPEALIPNLEHLLFSRHRTGRQEMLTQATGGRIAAQ